MNGTGISWHRSGGFILLVCIALAALWDFLFWERPIGISAAIFSAAICLILIVRAFPMLKRGEGRFITLVALAEIVALVEEPTPLAILMTLVISGTMVLVWQRDVSLWRDNVTAWAARWLMLMSTLWVRFLRDNVLMARWVARHPRVGNVLGKVLVWLAWWVLPVVVGLFFIGLFSIANPVIAHYIGNVGEYIRSLFIWLSELSFLRIALWCVVILATYGIFRHRHAWGRAVEVPPVVAGEPTAAWLTSPQMIARLLLVMNLVFLLENVLDACYIYFGMPLPDGLDYKHYCHRGAYTLIITALLAGGFTLFAFRPRGSAHRSKTCRWMVYVWIGQNIFLLISTISRVWIYVDTDKLTRLRLSTMIWCGIVAAGFLYIVLRIMYSKTNSWLWRMNVYTAMAVLFVCSFINFGGLIADFNVRHCAESGGRGSRLDIYYLLEIGPQALPATQWMIDHPGTLEADGRKFLAAVAHDHEAKLQVELSNWRGWTYRRSRELPQGHTVETAAK